jgi:hypothetical protein
MFDMQKTVELKGTIKDFQWTNPHTWTIVTVWRGYAHSLAEYGLEGMSSNYLSRNGWTSDSLSPATSHLLWHPLKDGRKGGSWSAQARRRHGAARPPAARGAAPATAR